MPLSTFESIEATLPPKWLTRLESLVAHIPARPWGSPGYPLVITSSNFGIGHILAYHESKVDEHLEYAQAHTSVEKICKHFGWRHSASILSHACVSADVGMLHASRLLHKGAAREVLVFSFDFLSPFVTGGFHSLKILNSAYPAPYANQENAPRTSETARHLSSKRSARFRITIKSGKRDVSMNIDNSAAWGRFRNASAGCLRHRTGPGIWVKAWNRQPDAANLSIRRSPPCFPKPPLVIWKRASGHLVAGMVENKHRHEAMIHWAFRAVARRTNLDEPTSGPTFATSGFQRRGASSNAFGEPTIEPSTDTPTWIEPDFYRQITR